MSAPPRSENAQLDPDVLLAGDEIVSFARAKFATERPGIIDSYMLSATEARRSHRPHCIDPDFIRREQLSAAEVTRLCLSVI
jgi:hypothetical protein